MSEHLPPGADEFGGLVTEVCDSLEQIGLYPLHAMIQGSVTPEQVEEGQTMRSLIDDGEMFVIRGVFRVGSLAWSDRVLRPERFEADKAFERAAPTELELELEKIRDSGLDILKLDDDDEEHDVQG